MVKLWTFSIRLLPISNCVKWLNFVISSGIEVILLPLRFNSFSHSIWNTEGNSVNWLCPLWISSTYRSYRESFRNFVRFLNASAGIDLIALLDNTKVFNSLRIETKAMFSIRLLLSRRHCNFSIFANAKSGITEIRLLPRFKNTKFPKDRIPRIPFPDRMLQLRFKYVSSSRFPTA